MLLRSCGLQGLRALLAVAIDNRSMRRSATSLVLAAEDIIGGVADAALAAGVIAGAVEHAALRVEALDHIGAGKRAAAVVLGELVGSVDVDVLGHGVMLWPGSGRRITRERVIRTDPSPRSVMLVHTDALTVSARLQRGNRDMLADFGTGQVFLSMIKLGLYLKG